MAARQRAVAERGGDPFVDYVLPLTAMLFTQGFGRLVRSETDVGSHWSAIAGYIRQPRLSECCSDPYPGPAIHEAADRDDAWTTAIEFVTGEVPDLASAISFGRDDVCQILDRLRLIEGEDPTAKLIEAAEKLFGITNLHPEQLEVMRGDA